MALTAQIPIQYDKPQIQSWGIGTLITKESTNVGYTFHFR
jgi:hypothetical protein